MVPSCSPALAPPSSSKPTLPQSEPVSSESHGSSQSSQPEELQKAQQPAPTVVYPRFVEILDFGSDACSEALSIWTRIFYGPDEPSMDQVLGHLRAGIYRLLVREDRNPDTNQVEVVAAAIVAAIPEFGVCHLDYLFVKPGIRGKGTGSTFFNEMVDFLMAEAKYHTLTLECVHKLVPWYTRMGAMDSGLPDSEWTCPDGTTAPFKLLKLPLSCSEDEEEEDNTDNSNLDHLKAAIHVLRARVHLVDQFN